jgi:cullin 3
MFKDMELSKDLQGDYRKFCGGSSVVAGVEFAAEVLTNGNWPIEDPIACTIP